MRAARLGRGPPLRPRQDHYAEELEAGKPFARYLDVDGDAISYRTLPGVHPTKGAYFTRGSSHNAYAVYSEEGKDYTEVMQRLLRKFETAKSLVPAPIRRDARKKTRTGAIYYGSTSVAMEEAMASLEAKGLHIDTLRIRAFPFADEVLEFVNAHDEVFLIEQNRDAQLRKLLVNECSIDPAGSFPSCTTTAPRSPRASSTRPSPNA